MATEVIGQVQSWRPFLTHAWAMWRPIPVSFLDSPGMPPWRRPEAARISHGRIGSEIYDDGRSSLPAR